MSLMFGVLGFKLLKSVVDKKVKFVCNDCHDEFWFDDEDPTTSSGSCKRCGSRNWRMFNKENEEC